jgi:putative transposase
VVLIGVSEEGTKALVAVDHGYRESAQSWYEGLVSVKQRGLEEAPKWAIGDGALGFWNARHNVYPATRHQRCWVHKTANVLNYIPN